MLVLLADPNAGTLSVNDVLVSSQTLPNDNCMSLVYFQGLGLIANGTAASAADTGAFTTAASLSGGQFFFFVLCDSCTVSFPGVLINS